MSARSLFPQFNYATVQRITVRFVYLPRGQHLLATRHPRDVLVPGADHFSKDNRQIEKVIKVYISLGENILELSHRK
jgi:hypothetical protein